MVQTENYLLSGTENSFQRSLLEKLPRVDSLTEKSRPLVLQKIYCFDETPRKTELFAVQLF